MLKPPLLRRSAQPLNAAMQDPHWATLTYNNPTKVLIGLGRLFDAPGIKKYKHAADILLKPRPLRHISEDRRCAIFLHGAGQALGRKILFASYEKSDYDYIGAYEQNGIVCRFPIQLKQFVPDRLNSSTNLQIEIDKLKKYGTSSQLVVAIHINRKMNLRPQDLNVSGLKVKEIWLFGQNDRCRRTWLLFGNLKSANLRAYKFNVPVA